MAIEETTDATHPGSNPGAPSPFPAFVDTTDDMYDLPEDLEGDGLLPRALTILTKICAPYWKTDQEAIEMQRKHHHITNRALISATIAVTVAILQLPILFLVRQSAKAITDAASSTAAAVDAAKHQVMYVRYTFALIEVIAASCALYYVIRGISLAVQKHWLLERHKSERLRFLKFRSLLKLLTVAGDPDLKHWTKETAQDAYDIMAMEESDVDQWIHEHDGATTEHRTLSSAVSESDINDILSYYKRKRLDRQVRYFYKKANTTLEDDWITKLLPPILFLASLGFALLHFAMDGFEVLRHLRTPMEDSGPTVITVVIIGAAALLPVWGAAVRTHRSANEYSRNTVRFSSMYRALKETSDILHQLPSNRARFERTWISEQSLEDEHRQWLSLMKEAEWFG
jgi:hypothetical protein